LNLNNCFVHNQKTTVVILQALNNMEIRTFDPEDVKGVATAAARSIPAEQIDATFKSQYTGMELHFCRFTQA
jgi:hypothetical protein